MGLYLEEHGSFRFGIAEFRFVFDGEAIYENANMTESLPFLMYRNGLRELWFDDGLTRRELTEFFKIFRSYEILKESYEDLVTLLWNKEFSSIHFWATDDFLWDPVEIPENMESITTKQEMPMEEEKTMEIETPLPHWFFKSDEFSQVKHAIPREIEQIDYINLVMILAEVVNHSGEDRTKFERVVEFFKRVLDSLLALQNLKDLIKIFSFTRILLRDQRLDSKEKEFINTATNYLGEPQSVERLMASLARFENFDRGQLQKYLFLLPTNALAPLCNAWLRMENPEGKMAIYNALVELGRRDVPTLGRQLKDKEWPLVSMVIDILGKIGNEECIHWITQMKDHESAEVRKDVLHALSRLNTKDSKILRSLLIKFLDDEEPEIRIDASSTLVKKFGAEALRYLKPRILSKAFEKRAMQEKKAFVQHLGMIEVTESVRVLQQILYRKVFLKWTQWEELKSFIESVLASMDLSEAKRTLAKWKENKEKWFFRFPY